MSDINFENDWKQTAKRLEKEVIRLEAENAELVALCHSLIVRMYETGDMDISSQAVIFADLSNEVKSKLKPPSNE